MLGSLQRGIPLREDTGLLIPSQLETVRQAGPSRYAPFAVTSRPIRAILKLGACAPLASLAHKEEEAVETYIIMGKWTQQGIAKVKEGPARIEAARKAMEAAGGKMIAWYLTLGRYDFVVIEEAPNVQAAAAVLLATGSLGNVSTETLHALTEAEFKDVVSTLP